MTQQDYEYSSLMAQFWDLLRGDTSDWPDRFFFLDVIAQAGQPVLDVGCGTGRLLLDYMQQGIDVDGVVVASEQRSRARATRGYTQAQAVALLQQAGFVDVHLTSGFTLTPAAPDDNLFCILATRP